MRTKKVICFFTVLLLLSALMYSVNALSDETVSFHGGGVTIDLTFSEEAHPAESIWHNVTITATNPTTELHNFTAVIKALVNSSWVEIFNAQDTFTQPLPKNYTLNLSLPQETNGTLQCFIYVNTNSIDDLSTIFYTTRVNTLTFIEMQTLYNEMLANYTALQADYQSLLDEYEGLLVNYSSLFDNYTALLSQYNVLSGKYNTQVAIYQTLLDNYNTLSGEYDALDADFSSKVNEFNTLEEDYNDLNSTRNSLQANYTRLQADYDQLNQTYTNILTQRNTLQTNFNNSQVAVENDRIVMFIFVIALVALIAFIIYLKRGKEEPYVVIRKETVNMKEEGS